MRGWTKEEVFHSGDKFFARLAKDIVSARKSIDLETYIFCDDILGRGIIGLLNDAAERGVRVRMMVDGVGSSLASTRFLYAAISPLIEARVFNPLPWAAFLPPLERAPKLTTAMRMFFGLNRRNHRKSTIIDGRAAFIGSMNICASHLESESGSRAWRDTGVRVEGPGVLSLATAFERTWRRTGPLLRQAPAGIPKKHRAHWRKLKSTRDFLVRLNDTWGMRHRLYEDLLRRIVNAERRIWITNAYFIPHSNLLRAIYFAAKRGVDVRILVPRECDVFFVPWVRSVFYFPLLRAGARIYEYLPSMLHAKTLIIDEWSMVGSSNMNHRSLHHDLEADVVLTMEKSKRVLAKQFKKDLEMAYEITFEDWQRRPWIQNSTGQALLLFKNWM